VLNKKLLCSVLFLMMMPLYSMESSVPENAIRNAIATLIKKSQCIVYSKANKLNPKNVALQRELNSCYEVIKSFSHMIDPDKHSEDFFKACCYGDRKIVELFLSAGCNKEDCDHEGKTPLMAAAYCGNKDVLELLLSSISAISSVDKLDNDKRSVLHYASFTPQEHTDSIARMRFKDTDPFQECRDLIVKKEEELLFRTHLKELNEGSNDQ